MLIRVAGFRRAVRAHARHTMLRRSASRSMARRAWLLTLSLVSSCQVWAARDDVLDEEVQRPSQLVRTLAPCSASGESALVRARERERAAHASWERTPFAAEEAPLSVLRMAEAESCYELAHDREGRQRARQKREAYAAELSQRWSLASLRFEVARRADALAEIRFHASTLLALSSQADDTAAEYRAWLQNVQRNVASALSEQASHEED